jgi:hypothetical protein
MPHNTAINGLLSMPPTACPQTNARRHGSKPNVRGNKKKKKTIITEATMK